MTDVSIVIVNYNVKNLVDNCISSIYKSNKNNLKLEIFLVDNNSVDGSAEYIKEKYPDVKVIALSENVGFSKANNVALRQAKGEYYLILNPDTILEENTFDKMINFCKNNRKTGAVSSKLILANGKLDSACKRSFPTPSVAIPRILGLSKLFPKSKLFGKYNLTYLDENKTHKVDAICGAFMFIPSNVLKETGLFDEDYFMYGEDLDLCYRINKKGYEIYYYPEVTTIHLKGESTKKTHLSYVNNFYGAMLIFVKKNFTGASKTLSYLLRFAIFWRSLLSYLKRIFIFFIYPIIDAILIFGALILSVKIRFDILPNKEYLFIISVYVLVWLFLLMIFGAYLKKYKLSILKVVNGIIAGFFVNSSITYFFKQYAFSREVILTSTVFALIFLSIWRSIITIKNFIESKNILLNKTNLLIIGKSKLNVDIEDKFTNKYNILYYNDLSSNYNSDALKDIILINQINNVVFTDDSFSNKDILNTMWYLRNENVDFKILPSGNELILSRIKSKLDEPSLIEIEYNINNKLNIFLKRTFDVVFGLICLITVYPIVFLYSKVSKNKLSRHTSKVLLIPSVISGKYSFVGYPIWFDKSNETFPGKKGLTGLIQLYYYDEMSEAEMINYNIYYAKNQNLTLDFEILLKTIFTFLKK